jgi:hypothetical protein
LYITSVADLDPGSGAFYFLDLGSVAYPWIRDELSFLIIKTCKKKGFYFSSLFLCGIRDKKNVESRSGIQNEKFSDPG